MADKEQVKQALKAFKKRLKLYRSDDESQHNRGKLTSGRSSSIVGIMLPDGFPPEVWAELEAKGRIKRVPGTETFELTNPPS